MQLAPLTFRSIRARAVVLKLKRPIVAKIVTSSEWPLILIDLFTEEGIVGRSYLEPYTIKTMRYLIPALQDFGEMLKGRRVAPSELYEAARKSLHFVGYEGQSMIAVSGLDMAAWDALAKARGVPLCVLLGGSVGPVKAYNSNGLWLQPPEVLACGRHRAARRGRLWRTEAEARPRIAARRSRRHRRDPQRRRRRHGVDGGLQPGPDLRRGAATLPHDRRCRACLDRRADRLRQSRRLRATGRPDQDADPDRREFLRSPRPPQGACSARHAIW